MKDKNFKNKKNFNKGDKPVRREKHKMTILTYEKSFETLKDMVDALLPLHPVIDKEIFKYNYTGPKDLLLDVLDYYTNNVPDIVERKNLPSTLNISANKVTLKTNKFFTIGWDFKFDENGFAMDIYATVTVVKREKNNENIDNMIKLLEENWSVVEKPNKK